MRNNPVCWFKIYVQDMARAKRFYESIFQVTLEKINSPDTEGNMIGCIRYTDCGEFGELVGI